MEYIVLDLEWNQASDKTREDPKLPFEIIEIGAVRMDETGQMKDHFSCLIRPQVYPELFYRVRDVVNLTQKELKKGISFPEAFSQFMKWCGKDVMFATWGSMDLTELQKNMAYYQLENPFEAPFFYYDVQKLYSLQYQDGKSRLALETAIDALQMTKELPFHRAEADAYYTGKIFAELKEAYRKFISVDYYRAPKTEKEELYMVFEHYSKFVSKTYPTRDEAMKVHQVTSTVCYKCRSNVKRRLNWFPDSNGKNYYALSYCPVHGWLKGKLRTKRSFENGELFFVKTQKLIGADEAADLLVRHEQLKQKRRERARQKNAMSLKQNRFKKYQTNLKKKQMP